MQRAWFNPQYHEMVPVGPCVTQKLADFFFLSYSSRLDDSLFWLGPFVEAVLFSGAIVLAVVDIFAVVHKACINLTEA